MAIQFSNGYALLIGVDQNAVAGWALPDVAKDIVALSAVLTHPKRCAYAQEHVRVLTGKEATKENILAGLTWLKEKLAEDKSDNETALIYYSGHGAQGNSPAQPAYYLIPYDVVKGSLRRTALRADDFAAEIAELNPRRLLVLLDCCHAGGIGVKDLEVATLKSFSIPPGWLMSGQKAVALDVGEKDIEAALLQQGSGRAVLNSSRSDEKSYIRKDNSMSIFTYHLIEALTGHAPHAPENKEVTAAELLAHVWHRVPQSAQAEYLKPQHPDGQISGNFPIALLLGGEGAPPEKSLPDPLEALPSSRDAAKQTIFDQRGQTVQGTQTNIRGNVEGPVFSGNFHGPVQAGSGRQVNVGDIHSTGGTVNIAGGDIHQSVVKDESIKVGNVSGSTGVAIGHGASTTVTQKGGTDPQAIARAFATLLKQVDKLVDEDQKEDARDALEKLKEEAKKGEQPNEGRVRKWLDFLAGMSGDIFEIAVATFTNPLNGLSTAFRKIAERAKEERDAS